MLTLYIAVMLNSEGQIQRTIGEGVYTDPASCYVMTQFPADETQDKGKFKCLKVQGNFVNFKIIEEK